MSRIPILIASAVALAVASPASAQPAGGAASSDGPIPSTRAEVTKALDARFATFDTNHDGSLSTAELQAVEAQVVERQKAAIAKVVDQTFAKLDTNKDGRLTLAEYRAATPKIDANPGQDAAALAKVLDTNNDGKISSDEFKRRTLSAFDQIDTNKDGVVSPEERRKAEGDTGR